MLLYVCKKKEQQPEREVEKMRIKLNTGVQLNYMSQLRTLATMHFTLTVIQIIRLQLVRKKMDIPHITFY